MVHRSNSSQYLDNETEESTAKFPIDDDDKVKSLTLPTLLNGLELRKIDDCTTTDDKKISTEQHQENENKIDEKAAANTDEKLRLRRNNSNRCKNVVPSSTTTTTVTDLQSLSSSTAIINCGGGENEDEGADGGDTANLPVGTLDTKDASFEKPPILYPVLYCSLPLERISDILEKLKIRSKLSQNEEDTQSPESSQDEFKKLLCLYCDHSFSSEKLRHKHLERVHQTKGRRLSSRKSILNSDLGTLNVQSTVYPGCTFCTLGKFTIPASENLKGLFNHFIEVHSDKYFACPICTVRFSNDEALTAHNNENHNQNTCVTSPLRIEVDFEKKLDQNVLISNRKIKLKDDGSGKTEVATEEEENPRILRRSSSLRRKHQLLRSEELILTRLGLTQNRSPRTLKGAKNRRGAPSNARYPIESKAVRNGKTGRNSTITVQAGTSETSETSTTITTTTTTTKTSNSLGRNDISTAFDDDFYESVNLNVRKNLSCHIDGKMDGGPTSPSPLSPIASEPPHRSTVVRSPHLSETEIHEATTLSAITAFPTLLTADQYGTEHSSSKLKRTFTKNSWKWKWDFIRKYKYVNEGGKIVKKIKQQTSGFRDLSQLDMWTQLTMRTKHELLSRQQEIDGSSGSAGSSNNETTIGEVSREEKRKLIEQLNTILDTRILPQINLEQNDQRVIKLEPGIEDDSANELSLIKTQYYQGENSRQEEHLTAVFNLRRNNELRNKREVILSGEWARPRCYVCFGCGEKFETLKVVEEHKLNHHPHVYSTHYEIVGRELIEEQLYRHFYIPSKALYRHYEYNHMQFTIDMSSSEHRIICVEDSMDSVTSGSERSSTTSITTTITKSETCDTDTNSKISKISSISSSTPPSSASRVMVARSSKNRTKPWKCTKCSRICGGMLDLYRHMLDCSGDYAWLIAKKRMKYRYFGNRSRRRRVQACKANYARRHKSETPQKSLSNGEDGDSTSTTNTPARVKEPQQPRSKPSDAESIQRMLANLPAKRACRPIIPNMNLKKTKRKILPVLSAQLKGKKLAQNQRMRILESGKARRSMRNSPTDDNRQKSEKDTTESTSDPDTVKMRPKTAAGLMQLVQHKTKKMVRKLTNFNGSKRRSLRSAGALGDMMMQKLPPKKNKIVKKLTFREKNKKSDEDGDDKIRVEKDVDEKSVEEDQKSTQNTDEEVDKTESSTDDKESTVEETNKDVTNSIPERKKVATKCGSGKGKWKKMWNKLTTEITKKTVGKLTAGNSVENVSVETKTDSVEEKESEKIEDPPAPASKETEIASTTLISSATKDPTSEKAANDVIPKPVQDDFSQKEEEVPQFPPSEPIKSIDEIKQEMDILPLSIPMPLTLEVPVISAPMAQPITPPCKKRPRKLNDCIAMLTGKLQEKLGMPSAVSEKESDVVRKLPEKAESPPPKSMPKAIATSQLLIEPVIRTPPVAATTVPKPILHSPPELVISKPLVITTSPGNDSDTPLDLSMSAKKKEETKAQQVSPMPQMRTQLLPNVIIPPCITITPVIMPIRVPIPPQLSTNNQIVSTSASNSQPKSYADIRPIAARNYAEDNEEEIPDITITPKLMCNKRLEDKTLIDLLRMDNKREMRVMEPSTINKLLGEPRKPISTQPEIKTLQVIPAVPIVKETTKLKNSRKAVGAEKLSTILGSQGKFESKSLLKEPTALLEKAKGNQILNPSFTKGSHHVTQEKQTPTRKPDEILSKPNNCFKQKLVETESTKFEKNSSRKSTNKRNQNNNPMQVNSMPLLMQTNLAEKIVEFKKSESLPPHLSDYLSLQLSRDLLPCPKPRELPTQISAPLPSKLPEQSLETVNVASPKKLLPPKSEEVPSPSKPADVPSSSRNAVHSDKSEDKSADVSFAGRDLSTVHVDKSEDTHPIITPKKEVEVNLKEISEVTELETQVVSEIAKKEPEKPAEYKPEVLEATIESIPIIVLPVPATNLTPIENEPEKVVSMENETTKTSEIVPLAATPPLPPQPSDKVSKPRKKRQNELTKIIADQLLESFKEVDKSRIDELKLLHDLSMESDQNDDILLSAVQSTPKRKSTMKTNATETEVKPPPVAKGKTKKKGQADDSKKLNEMAAKIATNNTDVLPENQTKENVEESKELSEIKDDKLPADEIEKTKSNDPKTVEKRTPSPTKSKKNEFKAQPITKRRSTRLFPMKEFESDFESSEQSSESMGNSPETVKPVDKVANSEGDTTLNAENVLEPANTTPKRGRQNKEAVATPQNKENNDENLNAKTKEISQSPTRSVKNKTNNKNINVKNLVTNLVIELTSKINSEHLKDNTVTLEERMTSPRRRAQKELEKLSVIAKSPPIENDNEKTKTIKKSPKNLRVPKNKPADIPPVTDLISEAETIAEVEPQQELKSNSTDTSTSDDKIKPTVESPPTPDMEMMKDLLSATEKSTTQRRKTKRSKVPRTEINATTKEIDIKTDTPAIKVTDVNETKFQMKSTRRKLKIDEKIATITTAAELEDDENSAATIIKDLVSSAQELALNSPCRKPNSGKNMKDNAISGDEDKTSEIPEQNLTAFRRNAKPIRKPKAVEAIMPRDDSPVTSLVPLTNELGINSPNRKNKTSTMSGSNSDTCEALSDSRSSSRGKCTPTTKRIQLFEEKDGNSTADPVSTNAVKRWRGEEKEVLIGQDDQRPTNSSTNVKLSGEIVPLSPRHNRALRRIKEVESPASTVSTTDLEVEIVSPCRNSKINKKSIARERFEVSLEDLGAHDMSEDSGTFALEDTQSIRRNESKLNDENADQLSLRIKSLKQLQENVETAEDVEKKELQILPRPLSFPPPNLLKPSVLKKKSKKKTGKKLKGLIRPLLTPVLKPSKLDKIVKEVVTGNNSIIKPATLKLPSLDTNPFVVPIVDKLDLMPSSECINIQFTDSDRTKFTAAKEDTILGKSNIFAVRVSRRRKTVIGDAFIDRKSFDLEENSDTSPVLMKSIDDSGLVLDEDHQHYETPKRKGKKSKDTSPKILPLQSSASRRKSRRNIDVNDDDDLSILSQNLKTRVKQSPKDFTPSKIASPKSESDDDVCLAVIAKTLNPTVISEDEFSNCSETPVIELNDQIIDRVLPPEEESPEPKSHAAKADETVEDNTNTDLIDMDLEDDMSVYTSLSMETSLTATTNSPLKHAKRRRHRKSILLTRPRKQKPKEDESTVEFICDLCNKVFRKQDSLTKHKMTLTHIAKLSEQEFLNSKQQQQQLQQKTETNAAPITPVNAPEPPPPTPPLSTIDPEVIEKVLSEPIIVVEKPMTPELIVPAIITNSGIEPISSPEQIDNNYDRYRNTMESSRFHMSQEEKLFFECCNMLKGSNRSDVTQQNFNIKSPNKNNIIYSVKSPSTQHPRVSPRSAIPKLDVNQFSDISSDSNQPYHPPPSHIPSIITPSSIAAAGQLNVPSSFFVSNRTPTKTPKTIKQHENHAVSAKFLENSMAMGTLSDTAIFSDMGESFMSSQDASESDNNTCQSERQKRRRVSDRKVQERQRIDAKLEENSAVDTPGLMANEISTPISSPYHGSTTSDGRMVDESKSYGVRPYESPFNSNSSQGSTASKFITKGALKGYDNFKVSIPTTGIDLQQVLVRSPHGASKLAALADIALGSDAPTSAELISDQPPASVENTIFETKEPTDSAPKKHVATTPLTTDEDKCTATTTDEGSSPVSSRRKKPAGNNLGFKVKKHLTKDTSNSPEKKNNRQGVGNKRQGGVKSKGVASSSSSNKKPIDVYEFEDSKDSADVPIVPLSKAKPGFRAKLITKEMVALNAIGGETPNSKTSQANDESQLSSTSFSDRDDFTFGVDSGVSESESEVASDADEDAADTKLPDTNNLQTKVLIMGRIFKNAKKTQPASQDVTSGGANEEKTLEKVQKLPKQELDKLFDSLKKVEDNFAEKEDEMNEEDHLDKLEQEIKRNDRKSKKSREIQSLEAEWGMSLEQIKEIIGVGQRKSTRKCAVGKQKILAETWSSDEYEDFHSTKDIIALIQETEIKAVQRRNRSRTKKNEEQSDATDGKINESTSTELDTADVTRNEISVAAEENKTKEVAVKEKTVDTEKAASKVDKFVELMEARDEESSASKKPGKIKPQQRRKSTAVKSTKLVYYDSESDFEADWNRSRKIKKRRKTTAFREINTKSNNTPIKMSAPPPPPKTATSDSESKPKSKKVKTAAAVVVAPPPPPITPETSRGASNVVQNAKSNRIRKEPKTKLDSSGKPLSRRKRIASEMLYYWSSSSSDNEFGRVDGSQDEEFDDEELTQEGEHLQQHGWIVGDSHKKLVTLLAHAKGKMSDDCGVKEAGNKKKS